MIAEALEYLRQHLGPTVRQVGDKVFADKSFTEIKPDPPELHSYFAVTTLGALRDLINCNVEGIDGATHEVPVIHIVNHQEVRLLVGVSDEHGRRRYFAKAEPQKYEGFKFNAYQSLETFRVGIQAHFAPTPDRDYVLEIASKVTDAEVAVSEDDGVSQQIEVKAGLALKGTEKLRSRVTLAPFRTFPEVDQPKSEFIFRARKQNGAELALFEADGGKWKIDAVQNIAFHLRDLEIKLPIIA